MNGEEETHVLMLKKACEALIRERDALALKVEIQEQALRDLLQVRVEEWGVGGIIE